MAQRKVRFAEGKYYHIYNRGANRENIFIENKNYVFLLQRIKKYISRFHISVIAYCLMPNHYHFLLRQDGSTSISKLIQAVFNSYSKAINKAYNKSGTLFEGPFKSVPVEETEYLLHLCRYIHRNPIDGKRPLVTDLKDWAYSNYPEWIGKRRGQLVDHDFIVSYFENEKHYQEFLNDYKSIKLMNEEMKSYLFD